ncbi:MAG: class I SAM-dependent methyltransferase [Chloroflexi bacterium]|nr:class I SAM-dependent methyltransferase [Chloroflexota bacterium]
MLTDFLRRLLPFRPPKRELHTLSSLDAYALWARAYPPNAHNALMQVEERAMLSLLLPLTGKTVLDLACGTGRYSLLAWDRGAKTVIGLDNSPAMLRANSLSHKALARLTALPLPAESLDVVICGLALGHEKQLDKAVAEIGRVLRKNAYALVSDFHPFMFLSGARRTFEAPGGQTYAVEHYAHLYADYHRAAWAAGLIIEQVVEPHLDVTPETGTANASATEAPVVIVYRFFKP